ncbi:MAG TPA: ABC transporter permease, partial [Terriglobia bacterium]|nr:ABC transporter permease [Terriglobia bacterium]
MRQLRAWVTRLGSLFLRKRRERELAEELESHLQMHMEDNIRRGMTLEEARREAFIKLGGLDQTKEEYRDRLGVPWLEQLVQDIRYGLRMLGKNPGFTAMAVMTLALGIGVNTAIFSVVNGWLRPLPVRDPEQLTVLAAQAKDDYDSLGIYYFSYPAFNDFRQQGEAFSDLFAYSVDVGGLTDNGQTSQFLFSYVTGNYFSALGINPAAGRFILPGEGERPGTAPIVVLGYSCWQKKFGGTPDAIGKQVLVDGKPVTIVGVAPKGFRGIYSFTEMDGYLPLGMTAANTQWADRNQRWLTVLGRLKTGLSLSQAQSSINVISERLAKQFPATDKGITVRVLPERLARPVPQVADISLVVSGLFLALATLVLLLSCLNVTNVLLVRATARQGEMAIRAALGSSRGRLIRQMFTESLLLVLLGTVAGVILGNWASSLVSSIRLETNLPITLDFRFDWRVFLYALAAALFAAIAVSVGPVLRMSRAELNTLMHRGGRSDSAGTGRHRVRNFLVVAQVAGSLVLLIA